MTWKLIKKNLVIFKGTKKKKRQIWRKTLICPLWKVFELTFDLIFPRFPFSSTSLKEIGWPKWKHAKFIFRVQKYLQDRDREHLGRFWEFLTPKDMKTYTNFFFLLSLLISFTRLEIKQFFNVKIFLLKINQSIKKNKFWLNLK